MGDRRVCEGEGEGERKVGNRKAEKKLCGLWVSAVRGFLSPLQGWATFNVDSRADALRFILPPRWGGGNSKAKERGPTEV